MGTRDNVATESKAEESVKEFHGDDLSGISDHEKPDILLTSQPDNSELGEDQPDDKHKHHDHSRMFHKDFSNHRHDDRGDHHHDDHGDHHHDDHDDHSHDDHSHDDHDSHHHKDHDSHNHDDHENHHHHDHNKYHHDDQGEYLHDDELNGSDDHYLNDLDDHNLENHSNLPYDDDSHLDHGHEELLPDLAKLNDLENKEDNKHEHSESSDHQKQEENGYFFSNWFKGSKEVHNHNEVENTNDSVLSEHNDLHENSNNKLASEHNDQRKLEEVHSEQDEFKALDDVKASVEIHDSEIIRSELLDDATSQSNSQRQHEPADHKFDYEQSTRGYESMLDLQENTIIDIDDVNPLNGIVPETTTQTSFFGSSHGQSNEHSHNVESKDIVLPNSESAEVTQDPSVTVPTRLEQVEAGPSILSTSLTSFLLHLDFMLHSAVERVSLISWIYKIE